MLLVPTLANLSAVVFITNFSGAIGDLWMVREMARFRHSRTCGPSIQETHSKSTVQILPLKK